MEDNGTIHVTGLTPDQPPSAPESTPEPTPPEDRSQDTSPAEPPAEVVGEAEPGEQSADSDHDDGETPTDQSPAAPAEEPRKPSRGVQKKIDQLTERAKTAETTAAQLAEALRIVNGRTQQPKAAPPAAAVEDKGPTPDQFPDWDSYTAAKAVWVSQKTATKVVEGQMMHFVGSLLQATQQNAENARQAALNQKIVDSTTKAAEVLPDWQDVLDCDLQVPPVLHEAIARSEDPAMALHYLAKHPQEHRRLISLQSPTELAFEAGKLFSGAKAPAVSKAPAPAKPIGSRVTAPSGYRDDFTPEQHKAWYAKNVAKG